MDIWIVPCPINWAMVRMAAEVEFLIDKTELLDRLRCKMNDRQHKANLRMLQEGPDSTSRAASCLNSSV
jgi:hypothetical protein